MAMITDELCAAQDQMLLLGQKTAIEKVASFILQRAHCDGTGNRGNVQIPMIGPDIADYLGLTAETVSRAFSELLHDRMIERPSNSCVRILDRNQLENCAVGSPQNTRECGNPASKVIQLQRRPGARRPQAGV
jgi:CRP/FNR family transcriptional regulator